MTRTHKLSVLWIALIAAFLTLHATGCSQNWHDKYDWQAENYFDDPLSIDLCHAIEAKNVPEIDRLVKAGADVNAKGRGNMTALLWALPGENKACFQRLLEHGANPNVMIDREQIPPKQAFWKHDSVTHMVLRTFKESYFDLVFKHGGDPKLMGGVIGLEPPIVTLVKDGGLDRIQKIERLLKLGADIRQKNDAGDEAVSVAVGWFGQYGLALWLLEHGADPRAARENQVLPNDLSRDVDAPDNNVAQRKEGLRLIHFILREGKRARTSPESVQQDYAKLVAWLEDHGESMEEARKDLDRWEIPYE